MATKDSSPGHTSPTYEQLFRSDAYYMVPPSRSVLSPAAYFVALMKLEEQNISGVEKTDPNSLQSRRPDLWSKVVLDEEDTDTLTPKLLIANKVLTAYLGDDGSDLAAKQYPFNLPYNQSLTEISRYLSQGKTSLPKIWENLIPSQNINPCETKEIHLQTLNLSPEQWTQYSTPNTTAASLNPFYGLEAGAAPSTKLAPVDFFLQQTGITYDQLTQLLYGDLSEKEEKTDKLNADFFINVGTGAAVTIEGDTLQNPSIPRLDRIERFVRLAQVLNWSFPDLDWALRTIGQIVNKGTPVINDTVLPYLAWMQTLKNINDLSINQSSALIGTLKDFGQANGLTFFSQIFENPNNPTPPEWVDNGKYGLSWLVPQPGKTSKESSHNKQIANALAASLQVSHDDLLTIANLVVASTVSKNNTLTLTLPILSLLYRLSLLPSFAGLSIKESLVAADFLSLTQGLPSPSGADAMPAMIAISDFAAWLETSPFSVYQLQFILEGNSSDPAVQNKILNTDAITNFLKNLYASLEKSLLTSTLFSGAITVNLQQVFSTLLQETEFITQLETALKTVPLTGEVEDILNGALSSAPTYVQTISGGIYAALQKDTYIDAKFVVLVETINSDTLEPFIKTAISSVLQTIIFGAMKKKGPFLQTLPKTVITAITTAVQKTVFAPPTPTSTSALLVTIAATISKYYQSQQTTFSKHLASLYNVSSQIGAVLKNLGGLNIDDLIGHQITANMKIAPGSTKETSDDAVTADVTAAIPLLQNIQQVAELITDLSLSPAEAQYFKTLYAPNTKPTITLSRVKITLSMVKIMSQFKYLVHSFQDTQNNLLNILEPPLEVIEPLSATDYSTTTAQLAKLSGWKKERIDYLMTQFLAKKWIPSLSFSVANVALLDQYFDMVNKLGIDVENLWQLVQLPNSTSAQTIAQNKQNKNTSQALWAGLQSKYKGQTSFLMGVQGYLNETLRDKLVTLSMSKLCVTTPRALYEYFLIDVEVSRSVQTSLVKEAISATQLYIYRCLNHMEEGVTLNPILSQLWTWMYAYTEWQANREVLLYPENYIEPELRKNKTELFSKLESGLKQANLADPESVNSAFQSYMNGFAESAQLEIVGSSSRDTKLTGNITREVCFIGKSTSNTGIYYYRVAIFTEKQDSDQYLAKNWGQWLKIGIQIQAVTLANNTQVSSIANSDNSALKVTGAVTPVFAFGKWYLFWVEQNQTGRKSDSQLLNDQSKLKEEESNKLAIDITGGSSSPTYTNKIQYSYLDFSKNWVSSKTLYEKDDVPTQINSVEESTTYPIYFNSIETLYVLLNTGLYVLAENAISNQVEAAYRFESQTPPPQISVLAGSFIGPNFNYYPTFDSYHPSGSYSFSTWFNLKDNSKMNLSENLMAQQGVGFFTRSNNVLTVKHNILGNTWYQLTTSKDKIYLQGEECQKIRQELTAVSKSVFYGATNIGIYKLNDQLKWIPQMDGLPSANFDSFGSFNGELYVSLATGSPLAGVYKLGLTNKWQPNTNGLQSGSFVIGFASLNGYFYCATSEHGVFKLNAVTNTWSSSSNIFSGDKIANLEYYQNTLYVGTFTKGIYRLDSNHTWQGYSDGIPVNTSVYLLKSFSGYLFAQVGLTKIYRLETNGVWREASNGIPAIQDFVINCLETLNDKLYIGVTQSSDKVYELADPDGVWVPFSTGLSTSPNDGIQSLGYDGSYWAGGFLGDDSALYKADENGTWALQNTGLPTTLPGTFSAFIYYTPVNSPPSGNENGLKQETLYFSGTLSEDQIKEMYETSKDLISHNFDKFIPLDKAFKTSPSNIPVVMQPNWNLISHNKAEFLLSPYSIGLTLQLFANRLSSSAIHKLGALLHQKNGIDELLTISAQRTAEVPFSSLSPVVEYIPATNIPSAEIDFSMNSAMSNYYWELFFHAPFLVANELELHQNFAAARRWQQYIFNPSISKSEWDIDNDQANPNDRFWRFLGLRESHNQQLKTELSVNPGQSLIQDINNQTEIYQYQTDPYDPQEIASLRPVAYQKTLLMHYVNNLINWGDMLFRVNTRESIVEAEMFYVAAYDLLGQKPENLGPMVLPETATLDNLDTTFFQSNGWIGKSTFPDKYTNYVFYQYKDSLYVATSGGGLYVSKDAGKTFTLLSANTKIHGLKIHAILVNDLRIYVTTDFRFYRYSNETKDWISIKLEPPVLGVNTLIKQINGSIYLGTEKGLYSSEDGKTFKITSNSTLATAEISAIYDAGGAIYAGTKGHGLWISMDFGKTWSQPEQLGGSLSINTIVGYGGLIIAGTDKGLWCQVDKGKWKQPQTQTPNLKTSAISVVHVTCQEIAYVAIEKTLWESKDNGISWAKALSSAATTVVFDIASVDGSVYVVQNENNGVPKGKIMVLPKGKRIWMTANISTELEVGFNSLFATSEAIYVVVHSMAKDNTPLYSLWISRGYFGIPRNQQFLSYWDEVQRRIYDIRHSLTIDGQPDVLPLFQPPINPMDLVASVASGQGLGQTTKALNAVIPYYRFSVMIEKAKSVTQTVTQLGQSLLSALEKKDAEQLAMLYNTNQQNILQLTYTSKQDQLSAATQNVQALQASLVNAQNRLTHYTDLINAGLLSGEQKQITLAQDSVTTQDVVEGIQTDAIIGYGLPDIFGFSDGGMKFGDAINQGANIAQGIGSILSIQSGLAGTVVSYQRRGQDWQLQQTIAQDDIDQINYQIVAAQYRQHSAEQDITLLEKNIAQNKNVADFYVKKFTNIQLYQWYIGQISALYFQAYELAHDIAMQAENAWKFEHIGRTDTTSTSTSFIKPGYWNNLNEGLLAGESLQLDLQRMEKAFTDQNERRLEIEKTISLAQLDPQALMDLKTKKGSCIFDIAEQDFDFDFPGHFSRQIKTLSLSLPVVLGPYQNVHATLTQLSNKIITSDGTDGEQAVEYLLTGKGPMGALKVDVNPNQQVALSQGVNDSGLFELNFNDARYLPFEGTGAVSSWMLEMPLAENSINFESLSDIIIQMKYTALAPSAPFKAYVIGKRGNFNCSRIFSLAQEFGPAWQEFVQSTNPQPLEFSVDPSKWRMNMSGFSITGLSLYLGGTGNLADTFTLDIATSPVVFSPWSNGVAKPKTTPNISVNARAQSWTLKYTKSSKEQPLPSGATNLILVVEYSAKTS